MQKKVNLKYKTNVSLPTLEMRQKNILNDFLPCNLFV